MIHLSAQQLDRAVGAVLASAAGDALGSQYEFGPALPDSVTPEFGVGCFGHDSGEWTDDTSMAMPILRQLAEGRALEDAEAISQIVTDWREWARTAKDVGRQTRAVLCRLGDDTGETAARSASEAVHRHTGRSAGNGSLMRTGPVALGYLDRSPQSSPPPPGDLRSSPTGRWTTWMPSPCGVWRSGTPS
ncbi:ADP-ribosylglycohydrolase family protein [Microbacterium sp. 179-I 1D1 NHS]|uniref:ADP-ribosylglycohydrolase family protein n=1 Tax=Microbacterium sp. 179-I 1D1 NHS TaxID=3374298 RepID=UPI003879B24C